VHHYHYFVLYLSLPSYIPTNVLFSATLWYALRVLRNYDIPAASMKDVLTTTVLAELVLLASIVGVLLSRGQCAAWSVPMSMSETWELLQSHANSQG